MADDVVMPSAPRDQPLATSQDRDAANSAQPPMLAEAPPTAVGHGTARPAEPSAERPVRTGLSESRDVGGRIRLAGHALHPMMVAVPIGLLTGTVLFDLIALATDRSSFRSAAALTLGTGVLAAAAAAVPGWVDWASIPKGTRARRVGLAHGLGNAAVIVGFGVSYLLRLTQADWKAPATALLFSFGAAVVMSVTSWLGGELVERHGVGVRSDASLDAPSSLRHDTT
jgi:uncharacterized membrane protein